MRARASAYFLVPAHARTWNGISRAAPAVTRRGCRLADSKRRANAFGRCRLYSIRGFGVRAPGEAVPPQRQLLAVRRLRRIRRGCARKTQLCASPAHLAYRQTQTAARLSAAGARCPAGHLQCARRRCTASSGNRREFFHFVAGLAVRIYAERAATQRGVYGSRLPAANRSRNELRRGETRSGGGARTLGEPGRWLAPHRTRPPVPQ